MGKAEEGESDTTQPYEKSIMMFKAWEAIFITKNNLGSPPLVTAEKTADLRAHFAFRKPIKHPGPDPWENSYFSWSAVASVEARQSVSEEEPGTHLMFMPGNKHLQMPLERQSPQTRPLANQGAPDADRENQ